MIRRAVILAALAAPVAAETKVEPELFAAKCAAFWLGWADASSDDWENPQTWYVVLASDFRNAAIEEGEDVAELDAYLTRERRDMAPKIRTLIIRATSPVERQRADVMYRLMIDCEAYAREHGF